MSQVASDPTIHAHSPHLSRPARPAQPSDRAPSPFESLIDDGSQPVEQPAPAPTDNKAAAGNGAQPPSKTNESNTPVADGAASTVKAGDRGPVAKDDSKPASDSKLVVDTKLTADVTPGDKTKAEGSDKPSDGQPTDKPVVTASPITTQATNTANAITAAPTPVQTLISVAPDQGSPDLTSQQITVSAQTGLQSKSLDANGPKATNGKKTDDGKAADLTQPAEADQPVDEVSDGSQATAKSPQPSHPDTAQFTLSESDKAHVADARGEPAVNGHHGSADAQASVTTDAGAGIPKITADTGTQLAVQTTTPPSQTTSNAAAPATLVSQPVPPAVAVPLSGVPMEIAANALAGKNRFEIRLDPPELGRIEVRLDVDKDGNVTSRMTVDRADTLDLLRRDATGLERALQDAGLKTTDNGLQFSLRDQSMGQQQTSAGPDAAQMIVTDDTLPSVDTLPQNYGRLTGTGGGLDIRV